MTNDGSAVLRGVNSRLRLPEPITGNGFRQDGNDVAPTTWTFAGTDTTNDLSFQLLNNQASAAAPESGTLALLGVGLSVVGMLARRKR